MALIGTLSRQGAPAGSAAPVRPARQQDPTAPTENGARVDAARGVHQDVYFFTSIEDFPPGIGDLSLTHDDAKGFHDYVRQFTTPNGWYKDASVGQWIYEETYDNYLDDYGFDAARVVYHSGHGDMDGNGVFWIPVGNNWGGDVWTSSNDMRLGNEYARYVFWSTCLSLRVKSGHTPIRTWSNANLGLRMIFGYETVSVDNGTYGERFFKEWNKGKSFSTAFMDGSWQISTSQEPSVVACGATQAEASDRVFNERLFSGARASTSWWWWRWYDAARARQRNLTLPGRTRSAQLGPWGTARQMSEFADRFGISVPDSAELRDGAVVDGGSGRRLAVGPDGSRDVSLAATSGTRQQLRAEETLNVARRAVQEYRLAEDVDLTLDHIRFDRHAGGSADERVDEAVRETHVFFTQVIDGVPVVAPGSGFVQIRVDNDGTVTGLTDTTRRVADLRDAPAVPPQPEGRGKSSERDPADGSAAGRADIDRSGGGEEAMVSALLDGALQRSLRRAAAGGRIPTRVAVVPDTTEIGYAFRDGDAVVVARQEVEVSFGQGLAKRYVLEELVTS